jgi:hypothetical protein
VNLFNRLRRSTPTEAVEQPQRRADSRTLLLDVLANGPVPTTIIEERGAAHGLSKKQLSRSRGQLRIVAFKEGGKGKPNGRWFWALPRHTPEM